MYSHGKGFFQNKRCEVFFFFFYTKLLPLKEKKIEKVNFLVTHYFLTLWGPVCIFNTKLHYEDISTLWTPKAISDNKVEF